MARGKKENFIALFLSVTAHLVLLLVYGMTYSQGLPDNRTPRFSVMPVILTALHPSQPGKGRNASFTDKRFQEEVRAVELPERVGAGLQKEKKDDLLLGKVAPAAARVAADEGEGGDRNKDQGGREIPVSLPPAPSPALNDAGGEGAAGKQTAQREGEGRRQGRGPGVAGHQETAKAAFADTETVFPSRSPLAGEKGAGGAGMTVAAPLYGENPPPAYPVLARRRGYEGAVTLSVEVLADGNVGRLEMKKSSGYELLDRTAWEAVKRWKFSPAKKSGKPVAMWVYVPVKFELN